MIPWTVHITAVPRMGIPNIDDTTICYPQTINARVDPIPASPTLTHSKKAVWPHYDPPCRDKNTFTGASMGSKLDLAKLRERDHTVYNYSNHILLTTARSCAPMYVRGTLNNRADQQKQWSYLYITVCGRCAHNNHAAPDSNNIYNCMSTFQCNDHRDSTACLDNSESTLLTCRINRRINRLDHSTPRKDRAKSTTKSRMIRRQRCMTKLNMSTDCSGQNKPIASTLRTLTQADPWMGTAGSAC